MPAKTSICIVVIFLVIGKLYALRPVAVKGMPMIMPYPIPKLRCSVTLHKISSIRYSCVRFCFLNQTVNRTNPNTVMTAPMP